MQTPRNRVRRHFYVREAAKLSGLSEYMVDYLCRTNILPPTVNRKQKRGVKRLYSFGDVVMLRVIASLLETGVSVARLGRALRALRRHHAQITDKRIPAPHLLSDGENIYFVTSDQLLTSLTEEGQTAFSFVVGLDRVRLQVAQAADLAPPRERATRRSTS